MTCREFVEFLMEYMGGELPELEKTRFDEHLAICPPCTAYMATYKATVEMGRTAFGDLDREVPEEVPEELVEAILAARKRETGGGGSFRPS